MPLLSTWWQLIKVDYQKVCKTLNLIAFRAKTCAIHYGITYHSISILPVCILQNTRTHLPHLLHRFHKVLALRHSITSTYLNLNSSAYKSFQVKQPNWICPKWMTMWIGLESSTRSGIKIVQITMAMANGLAHNDFSMHFS